MEKENLYTIYSVESRKGGVGKTTMALNLSKVLLKDSPVLLLDCDITGTSITIPAKESSFWKEKTNMLQFKKKEANLLEVFDKYFLRGDLNMEELINMENVDSKKINILGSSIYDEKNTTILDPSLLMDEIHSCWLVEFVFNIAKEFQSRMGKQVAIVIDNSPGFVGFNAALHRQMAKNGPQSSKFLFVSSLDVQDLDSCISAVAGIRQLFDNHLEVQRYVQLLKTGGASQPNMDKKLSDDSSLNTYFYELIDDDSMQENQNDDSIDSYISLLINKVPEDIVNDDFYYSYQNVLSQDKLKLLTSVTNATPEGTPENVISFDPSISHQFYSNAITPSKKQKDYDWDAKFEKISHEIQRTVMMTPSAQLHRIQKIYSDILITMAEHNNKYFVSRLPSEWNPNSIDEQLSNYLKELVTYDKFNFFIKVPISNDRIIRDRISKEISSQDAFDKCLQVIFDAERRRVSMGTNAAIKRMFYLLLYVFILYYRDHTINVGNNEILSILKDMRDYEVQGNWMNLITSRFEFAPGENFIEGYKTIDDFLNKYFPSFCKVICNTIMRMMTVRTDVLNVIKLFRLFIPYSDARIISKDIRDYMNSCIIDKTEEFSYKILIEKRQSMSEMISIQTILKKNVLKAWK